MIIPDSQEKYFILSLSACDTAASVQGCADLVTGANDPQISGFFSSPPAEPGSEAGRIFKGSLPVALKPQLWLFPWP